MSKLPNLKDIETVSETIEFGVESHLDNTENVLKRLMINIQAFKKIEQELGREIQLLIFKSLSKINSKELKSNIVNGYIFQGELK